MRTRFLHLAFALLALAGSSAAQTEDAEALYQRAAQLAQSGQPAAALAALQESLGLGLEGASQRFLLDSRFEALRGEQVFRGLARSYSSEAPLRMLPEGAAGTALIIEGQVFDREGKPASAIVYAYHRNPEGLFSEADPDNPEASEIFGYVRTKPNGRFRIETIRPAPAPERVDAQGAARFPPGTVYLETTLWDGSSHEYQVFFSGDARLTHPHWMAWAEENEIPIVKFITGADGKQRCAVILRAKG